MLSEIDIGSIILIVYNYEYWGWNSSVEWYAEGYALYHEAKLKTKNFCQCQMLFLHIVLLYMER